MKYKTTDHHGLAGGLLRSLVICLLVAAFLSGCGGAATLSDPTPEPTPTPTPEPTPDPETLARQQRLENAKDGFLWDEGRLQAIDEEGNYIADDYIGVLYFDPDGYYTSGDSELDELVATLILEKTDPDMTRMEMLRAMYDHTLESITYVGLANQEYSYLPAHGEDGWMVPTAIETLKNERGNCYCYAAELCALARGLGFQAYATGGMVGATMDPHGWVQILDENGTTWMCDSEIAYRQAWYQEYMLGQEPDPPDLFYKAPDEIGIETGLSYTAQHDPYLAEAEHSGYVVPEPETQWYEYATWGY